jgi:serine/threonine-protein kinase HipA
MTPLDVHVLGDKVGTLFKERDEYVFQYDKGIPRDRFVSLAMPVRMQPWIWPRDLHPYFRQNLPEGYLLSIIREDFGRLLDGTDLSLLAVVGGSAIGRVTITFQGQDPSKPTEEFDVSQVLHGDNTQAHFASLVRHYARAAISGAVPKFLAPHEMASRQPGAPLAGDPLGKTSMRTSRYIVKGSDEQTPFLGFNEHYSMRLLERIGQFPVAKTTMSDDGRALIVERFDVDADGRPSKGVEDMCGLLGLPPTEKYASTTEQVVKAARPYFSDAAWQQQSRRLAWLILSTYVVRNADCHTKNIALLYTNDSDVGFAPVYEMVTTQAYARYADNPPGLSIAGRKTWAPGKALINFIQTRLNISSAEVHDMVAALCDAAVETGHEVIAAAQSRPEWREVAKNMVHAWNDGMEAVRSPKPNVAFRGLTAAIEEAKFSEPAKPTAPEKVGRSPLLPKSGRGF